MKREISRNPLSRRGTLCARVSGHRGSSLRDTAFSKDGDTRRGEPPLSKETAARTHAVSVPFRGSNFFQQLRTGNGQVEPLLSFESISWRCVRWAEPISNRRVLTFSFMFSLFFCPDRYFARTVQINGTHRRKGNRPRWNASE